MRLLWLESKRFFCSFAFLIYVVLTCLFVFLNVNPLINRSLSHMPSSEQYDTIYATDLHSLKDGILEQLNTEYTTNHYTTYPLGFAKIVSLTPSKQAQIRSDITTIQKTSNHQALNKSLLHVDRLLGGHSSYSLNNVATLAHRKMTPQEAHQDYQLILKHDRISGDFARIFADIAGLIMGILPTVLVIAFCDTDHRNRTLASIHAKYTSQSRRLVTQYCASLIVLLLPILIMGIYFLFRVFVLYPHNALDLLAFLKVTIIWILPTLMISSAVGFLTYQLFHNFFGLALQFIWWLITIMVGAHRVDGNYGWLLIPRHNSLHNVAYFYDHLDTLLLNRAIYSGIALLLIGLTIIIIHFKKEGISFAVSRHHQRS
ncbi:hypothetical protein FC26_GL000998 [Paucilactobacillus vaccinostercus DSM 20634]|uniref:Uncharacterized protein n=1 Tax=Paucilactobacillus vaccinostercus DSM 20634 TaxID=1423813 RepID=A0A0R2A4I3_9LACO|nr:ABC transporter permease [Paucilactobacillus vaccinostercus]KRM61927.1 hypothetical protein FC26_GL000998 [Paucilactobacillus vaccinostercus DSM 20634]